MLELIWQYIKVALMGLTECFVASCNVKFIQRNKKLLAWIASFIGIQIWFCVIDIAGLHNNWLKQLYAVMFATGDVLAIIFDKKLDKLTKDYGIKNKKKHRKITTRKR